MYLARFTLRDSICFEKTCFFHVNFIPYYVVILEYCMIMTEVLFNSDVQSIISINLFLLVKFLFGLV